MIELCTEYFLINEITKNFILLSILMEMYVNIGHT